MKIFAAESVVLSYDEVATLSHAKDILEEIAVNSKDINTCALARAIIYCLDIFNDYYIEEDY